MNSPPMPVSAGGGLPTGALARLVRRWRWGSERRRVAPEVGSIRAAAMRPPGQRGPLHAPIRTTAQALVDARSPSVQAQQRIERHRLWAHPVAAGRLCAGALACLSGCLGPLAGAGEVRLGGSGAGVSTLRVLAEAHARHQPQTTFTVLPGLGSGGGIRALQGGAVDIAVSARALTDAEARTGLTVWTLGRTPLVLAVADVQQTPGLSHDELVAIYQGTRLHWPDGSPLRLLVRPPQDSDHKDLAGWSPAMKSAVATAERRQGLAVGLNDQEAADYIERTAGTVGPTTLALILGERRRLRALPLNGVAPTPQAIADGSYPLYKEMRLITAPTTAAEARALIGFIRTPEGQALLGRLGYRLP